MKRRTAVTSTTERRRFLGHHRTMQSTRDGPPREDVLQRYSLATTCLDQWRRAWFPIPGCRAKILDRCFFGFWEVVIDLGKTPTSMIRLCMNQALLSASDQNSNLNSSQNWSKTARQRGVSTQCEWRRHSSPNHPQRLNQSSDSRRRLKVNAQSGERRARVETSADKTPKLANYQQLWT